MKYNINMRKCASVKTLMKLKDITREDAEAMRQAWQTIRNRQEARGAIDKILQTFGVEYLGQHRRTGEHIYYCNAGDSYAGTILFSGLRMYVGTWSDLVENNLIHEAHSA